MSAKMEWQDWQERVWTALRGSDGALHLVEILGMDNMPLSRLAYTSAPVRWAL